MLAGFAAAGAVATIAAGSEPGLLLGGFMVAGTVIAALAVRPGAVHVLIPMPALTYLVAGPAAGLIHDRAADTSRTALIASATQWLAGVFLGMVTATMVAIAITAARRSRPRRAGPHGCGPKRAAGRRWTPCSRPWLNRVGRC